MSKKVYFSDFDGTLTTSDSMFRIIRYHRGTLWLITTLMLMLPLIILMLMGKYSNHRTKEILLSRCFGRMSKEDFTTLCQRFAASNRDILRTSLYKELLEAKRAGHDVVVVTASPELWVSQFVPDFKVLGTQLEFDADGFTGHFLSANCYGQEKVNRIVKEYPELISNRAEYHVTAYGDSRGDREMLAFADEAILIKD